MVLSNTGKNDIVSTINKNILAEFTGGVKDNRPVVMARNPPMQGIAAVLCDAFIFDALPNLGKGLIDVIFWHNLFTMPITIGSKQHAEARVLSRSGIDTTLGQWVACAVLPQSHIVYANPAQDPIAQ